MPFMEAEITDRLRWIEVDGPMGTECIPEWLTGDLPADETERNRILSEYTENREYWTVTRIVGYGVRLSAPGYLDCTPWEVYTLIREATTRYNELRRGE